MRKKIKEEKREMKQPVLYKPVEYLGTRIKVDNEEIPTFFDSYHIIGSKDDNETLPHVSIFMNLEQSLYIDNVGKRDAIDPDHRWKLAKCRFYHLNNSLVFSLFNSIISYLKYEFEFIEEGKIEELTSYFSDYFSVNDHDTVFKNCFLRITYELESQLKENKPTNFDDIKNDITEIAMIINSYIFDCIYRTFIGYFEDKELCILLTQLSKYIADFYDKYIEIILQFMMEYVAYYKPRDIED